MTPEEENYEEALRRIKKAKETEAVELNLRWLKISREGSLVVMNRLPQELADLASLRRLDLSDSLIRSHQFSDLSPLAGLTSLQSLNLAGCEQLSDLTPLAGLASLQSLDLSGPFFGSSQLSDLSPLAGLTSLQALNLSWCRQLRDLSPLAGLSSLQKLDIEGCEQLSDLSLLASLTSLQVLHLSKCLGIRRFAPLKSLLPTLKQLYLFGCKLDDLPPEVCGESKDDNVLNKVRAHYKDLNFGLRIDAEVKVLFLGNGGAGKTQLCRRLRDLPFDPNIPTTHGVQLGQTTVELDGFPQAVRLNLWDFGGQDIYHGSHALFLQLEHQTTYQEGELSLRHRPLSYWVDYLRAFAGTDASVLIVQSQCELPRDRASRPPVKVDDFFSLRWLEVSAKTGLGLNLVKAALEESVRDRFEQRPPPPIGIGRVAVRDRVRQMLEKDQKREPTQRQHRLLERAEFDRICDEVGGVSDKDALLDFLHHNGVMFYRPGLFGDRIVLDQNWALEAIYSIFHRDKCFKQLKKLHGRFSREDLELLIWSGYTLDEQKVFLGMMESCGICFRVRELTHASPEEQLAFRDKEWEYIAPELLPKWSDAQEQLLGRLRDDPPDAEASASYAFLHEGVLRGYLSKLGEHAKDAAIYWKYGCWFFEQKTRSQVLIESRWDDAASEAGAGKIWFRAWGERADDLIEQLLRTLQKLPVGQPPEIKRFRNAMVDIKAGASVSSFGTVEAGASSMEIPSNPELPPKSIPEIFVSYAWGDDSSEDARKRTEIVDRLCERLDKDGWNILRDSDVLRSGDLISGFMKRIGLADHVIVVLSDKYLRSPYCMTELHAIYQRSIGEKEDFRLYKAIQEWHNRIGDMLALCERRSNSAWV